MYNGIMPANAAMSDVDIASVLTYVRSSMSNTSGPVTVEEVAKIRKAAGPNPAPITAKDLIDPSKSEKASIITEPTELEGFKPAIHNTSGNTILYVLGAIALCGIPAIIGFLRN